MSISKRRYASAAVFVTVAVFSTLTLADELPIPGVYGDELGCARVTGEPTGISEPGGINVYPDRLVGLEWGCSWAEVWTFPGSGGSAFAVQGLCGAEGVPFLEQYIIQLGIEDRTRMSVFAASGEPRWELSLCEAPDPNQP